MSDSTSKPFISLDTRFPGIVSLFFFDKQVAKDLSKMAQDMMRRTPGGVGAHRRTLTPGDRELIAAYVSKGNECQFCYRSHKACAQEMNNASMVNQVVENHDFRNISPKMAALLDLAEGVRSLNRAKLPELVNAAKQWEATDQDIHDTVFISAFFNMCNRYVDGLGTTFEPGQEIEGGKGLAKYGYLMTIRRFFGQVLPSLFSGKRSIDSVSTVR